MNEFPPKMPSTVAVGQTALPFQDRPLNFMEKLTAKLSKNPLTMLKYFFFFIAVLWFIFQLASCIYMIPTDSEGVLTRFKRPMPITVKPGLHCKLPFIDEIIVVPVSRQMKQEYGYATEGATNPYQTSNMNDRELCEKMVTGDLNEVRINWVVQYRIIDPLTYLFKNALPEESLRDLSESAMRTVAGDRTIDEIMTFGRQEAESQVLEKLQELAKRYELGIKIDQIQLKMVNPPEVVERAFNEVNQSKQQREELINIARGEYNKRIPRAKGEADQIISQAQGFATQRVNQALGDVSAFSQLLVEYKKAPEITKKRLYLESMSEILPLVKKQIIIDDKIKSILPTMPLGPILNSCK